MGHRRIVLWILLSIVPAMAAAQASSRFEIVPGVGFGPIREATTHAALVKLFGTRAVVDRPIALGEGFCTAGSVVFPNTANEVEIAWQDKARARPAFVRISKAASEWKTRRGVRVGTSLRELESISGRVLTFLGFGWDYGGGMEWGEGGGALRLQINPDPAQFEDETLATLYRNTPEISGDREVQSNHPVIRKLKITVDWIRQDWARPFDEFDCQ